MNNQINTSSLIGSIESNLNISSELNNNIILGSINISNNSTIEADSINTTSVSGIVAIDTSINGEIKPVGHIGRIEVPKSVTKYVRYFFEEGITDGAFLVIDDKGNSQIVPIHGLHEIAISGNINDLEQNEDDYVMLYCGTSTKVI